MSRRTLLHLLPGVLISAICLWYAFREVDFSAMAGDIAQVGGGWVAASVLVALASLVLRGMRWRYLLSEERVIGSWSLVSATFVGMMANNLLPARLGEIVRAWVLARRERTSTSSVLASVFVERLADVVTALLLLGLGLTFSPALGSGTADLLGRAGMVVLAGVVILAAGFVLVIYRREQLVSAGEAWARKSGRPWVLRAVEQGQHFLDGLCVLQGGRQWLMVIVLSVLVWSLSIASFYAMGRGVALPLTVMQTTLVWVIVLFGVAIPSAPGFVGTFHGFCVAALALVAGADPTRAAVYATLLHGSHWLVINGVGLGCLLADRSVSWTGLLAMTRPDVKTIR